MAARLEHVNFTAPDPDHTAAWLCDLLGWHVRWTGTSINDGYTVHVGTESHYLAIYTGPGGTPQAPAHTSYSQIGGFNHVGIVVDDLDAIRTKVRALGYVPGQEENYEPGRRFYFSDENNVEYEMIQYD